MDVGTRASTIVIFTRVSFLVIFVLVPSDFPTRVFTDILMDIKPRHTYVGSFRKQLTGRLKLIADLILIEIASISSLANSI